ncbi:hypothetical protein MIND_00951800 [Mycena indigotica]|uniref:Uncharacterized protein n=1 Tax=Mycena indigotica TaxID=2126181 RepID=A0A8H6SDY2_9AGAR|nr:uncharacterized protein MIND_00951800 [Mycena indigotica]KAF7297187.1 hypothetical protein MIND_00951800 [Mycena indigotica]
MAGTKRSSTDSGPSPRAAKAAKKATDDTPTNSKKGGAKKTAKPAISTSDFKHKALPLHVNLTHTPPTLSEDKTAVANIDPGHLGSLALVATSFSTGSYGWKGSKRLTVELQNSDSGEKEKVSVMLTINATVVGSKGAKDKTEGGDDNNDDKDGEESAEEADEE